MLVPVLAKVAIGSLGESITLRDATGAYNVSTNAGGYGSPNMASPPAKIGLTWREWSAAAIYANFVSADSSLITELLSSLGYKFLASDIGITVFAEGIQHIKYYPFIQASGTDTYRYDSITRTFTRTTGSYDLRATYLNNPAGPFLACLVLYASSDAPASQVLQLGNPDDWTENTFTIAEDWVNSTGSQDLHMMWATEADLKILIVENTKACIAGKVGKLASMNCCDRIVIDKLTDISMWVFAADVKVQCLDYEGANSLIQAAYKECTYCISEDCTTCNS